MHASHRRWLIHCYLQYKLIAAQGTNNGLQDPIHYPHGTKFMAPGPMGQCFPIPDDDDIKRQMITTAENQHKIFRMYNFDYVTQVSFAATCHAYFSLLIQLTYHST